MYTIHNAWCAAGKRHYQTVMAVSACLSAWCYGQQDMVQLSETRQTTNLLPLQLLRQLLNGCPLAAADALTGDHVRIAILGRQRVARVCCRHHLRSFAASCGLWHGQHRRCAPAALTAVGWYGMRHIPRSCRNARSVQHVESRPFGLLVHFAWYPSSLASCSLALQE